VNGRRKKRGKGLNRKKVLDVKKVSKNDVADGAGAEGVEAEDADIVDDKEEESLAGVFCCYDFDALLVFSEDGQAFMLQALDVAQGKKGSEGTSFAELLPELGKSKISALITVPHGKLKDQTEEFVVLITASGMAKKINLSRFRSLRPGKGVTAIKVLPGDKLRWAHRASANCALLLATEQGLVLRTSLGPNWRSTSSLMGQGNIAMKMRVGSLDAIASTAIHEMTAAEIKSIKLALAKKQLALASSNPEGVEGGTAVGPVEGGTQNAEPGDDEDGDDQPEEEDVDDDEEEGGEPDEDGPTQANATQAGSKECAVDGGGEAAMEDGEAGAVAAGEPESGDVDMTGADDQKTDERCALWVTQTGMGMRVPLACKPLALARKGGKGKRGIKLIDGDKVVSVCVVSGIEEKKPEPRRDAFSFYFEEHKDEIINDPDTATADAEETVPGNGDVEAHGDAAPDEEGKMKMRDAPFFRKQILLRERLKALPADEQRVYLDRAEEDAKRYALELEELTRLAGEQDFTEEVLVGSMSGKCSRITVGSIQISRKINKGKAVVKCKGDRICSVSMLTSADVDPNEGGDTSKPVTPAAPVVKRAPKPAAPPKQSVESDGHVGTADQAPASPPPRSRPAAPDLPPLWKVAGLNDSTLPPLSLTPRRKADEEGLETRSPRRSAPPWLLAAKRKGRPPSRFCFAPHPPTPSRNRPVISNCAREVRLTILKPKLRLLGKTRLATSIVRDVDIVEWAKFATACN
jgi:DNA gyrase/topoisomerase IV subunit A